MNFFHQNFDIMVQFFKTAIIILRFEINKVKNDFEKSDCLQLSEFVS